MLRIIKFFIFLVAFTPIVVDTGSFFPYIEGKTVAIRLLVTIAWLLTGIYAVFSKDFSEKISNKFKVLIKNPIFVSFGVFMLAVGISTVTAFFKFRAFFGDVERGEGFVGLIYLYLFFVLAVFIFERKDWFTFFKLSLLVGAVMFIDSIRQLIGGNSRPSSFTGNPIYLAGYLLFTIYAGLIVFKETTSKKIWKWFGIVMVPASLIGIFITQTRGVMLGIVAGVIVVASYLGIKGKNVEIFKKWNLRKVTILAVILLIVFGGIFIVTKNISFWQKIPGLGRLAQFNLSDANFQTRLISLGVSWNAINPANEGVQKFLFGWGPENFSIAYNKHYNPNYFKYETSWFDRAHNKLMDVMVMNGLFGLLSYSFLWLFVIIAIFKIGKRNLFLSSLGIFFAVSYFVQDLTVFESLPTYIVLYAFWGFLITDGLKDDEVKTDSEGILGIITFMPIAIILLIGLIWITAIPYFQMRGYISLKTSNIGITQFSQEVDNYLSPYTYAQENIRSDLLTVSQTLTGKYGPNGANGDVLKLYEKALDSMKELVNKEPYSTRYYLRLAVNFNDLGRQLNNDNFYNQAINYANQALVLTPNRQDVTYVLGYSYLLSNRIAEAVSIYKKAFDVDSSVASSNFYYGVALATGGSKNYKTALDYLEYSADNGYNVADNGSVFVNVYKTFANYFYSQREQELFVTVIKRLTKVGAVNEADVQKAIDAVDGGNWQAAKLLLK
jgi:O-antigen ligase